MFRLCMIGILCGGSLLTAGDFSAYRGLQFGMSLTTAATQTERNWQM